MRNLLAMRNLLWADLVLGLWLVVGPVFLDYTRYRVATLNTVLVGLVVAILSAIVLYCERAAGPASGEKPKTP